MAIIPLEYEEQGTGTRRSLTSPCLPRSVYQSGLGGYKFFQDHRLPSPTITPRRMPRPLLLREDISMTHRRPLTMTQGSLLNEGKNLTRCILSAQLANQDKINHRIRPQNTKSYVFITVAIACFITNFKNK